MQACNGLSEPAVSRTRVVGVPSAPHGEEIEGIVAEQTSGGPEQS